MAWPNRKLYDKQVEVLYSLRDNPETLCHAGNKLGKDYIAGVACIWFFVSRTPCRVVTSSSGEAQLEKVLWSEIKQRIDTCAFKLPLKFNHLDVKKIRPDGTLCPLSYLVGHVTKTVESFQGHHLPKDRPRVLYLADEASGIEDEYKDAADSWAHRKLIIGNPLNNDNFFYRDHKQDLYIDDKLYRKVIHISGEDSPNVKKARQLRAKGVKPPYPILIPGLVDWDDVQVRLATWDPIKLAQRHYGLFYEGKELLMFPPELLDKVERVYEEVTKYQTRRAEGIGVDPGEGGDPTCWYVVDRHGCIERYSKQTPDTSEVPDFTEFLIKKHNLQELPECCMIDVGGGGKEHADLLRKRGFNVSTVHFAEAAVIDEAQYSDEKRESGEQRQTYRNRRVQMYWEAREVFETGTFGVPASYTELRKELAPTPIIYQEGTLILPPKNHANPNYKGKTMIQLIGHSPNEADALVLGIHGMTKAQYIQTISMD